MTRCIFRCLSLALCGAALLTGVLRIIDGHTARGMFVCVVAVLLFAANAAGLRHEDER